MLVENKKVSQLVSLPAGQVQPEDLFLIIDTNAKESKNITAQDLSAWLNTSGSLYALHSINADTASYVLAANVIGVIVSSSYALSASTALYANFATNSFTSTTASYAKTASFLLSSVSNAKSASYLIYTPGTPNGTASWANTSSVAIGTLTSSFLLYFGRDNGTASYAMTTQTVNHATNADTASYFSNTGFTIATASFANTAAFANTADISNATNYLNYFGTPNGTASYALIAQNANGTNIVDYGVFLAVTQSAVKAQLDDIDVLWSTLNNANTPIEAVGTINVPFTSSTPTAATLSLYILDRNTGIQTQLDSTPITYNIGNSLMNTYGGYDSGSIKMPFSLMGQSSIYGNYMVFVTASNNINIESSRTVRFNVASQADVFNEYPAVPMNISTASVASVPVTFTYSTIGGSFTGPLSSVVAAGIQNILTLDAVAQNMTALNYYWTLTNVTESNFSNNPLTYLSGGPPALLSLNCLNCSLTSLYSFVSTSLSMLNCSYNQLTSLPDLPSSMSYLNCSNNQITSLNLPLTLSYLDCSSNQLTSLPNLPSGSYVVIADNNNLLGLPFLPETISTMSLNDNVSLNAAPFALPANLTSFSANNCPFYIFPVTSTQTGVWPTGILSMSLNNCNLFQSTMASIITALYASASAYNIYSGYVDIRGNGVPDPSTAAKITTLTNSPPAPTGYGWTILHD